MLEVPTQVVHHSSGFEEAFRVARWAVVVMENRRDVLWDLASVWNANPCRERYSP